MKAQWQSERGQALILIVFAIVGLIGMVALATDGGNAYSDRRHAQNAADTAVLAAAHSIIRSADWKPAALAIAATNGYGDTDATIGTTASLSNVEVYRCNESDPAVDCGQYDIDVTSDASRYVQVKITSTVNTFFAPVIGIRQVTNVVQAIALANPGDYKAMFMGNAIVALAPHTCQATTYQGTADTVLSGGGIFVNSDNSDCVPPQPDAAFFNKSNSAALTTPSLCVVGDIVYNPPAIDAGWIGNGPDDCEPFGFPPEDVQMPNITCPVDATWPAPAPAPPGTMTPGNYTGTFPPAGITNLQSGTYCVFGEFRLNAGQSLTGIGVVIVVHGDIVWNGSAEPHLSPPEQGDYSGLLLYVPLEDPIDYTRRVWIDGNSNSELAGTILAPAAHCNINGTGDLDVIEGQIICYLVDLSGTSGISIVYNDLENFDAQDQPALQLTQ